MKTSGSNFELIMQEVLKQKQLSEDLQSENDELHRQLAELREGRGIFVDILGEHFTLVDVPVSDSPDRIATPEADLSLQEIEFSDVEYNNEKKHCNKKNLI